MEDGLQKLGTSFRESFAAATTEQQLRDAHARVLGKKGDLTQLLRRMGALPAEQRKIVGEKVNQLKSEVESAFTERLSALERAAREADLRATPYDLTLPGRRPAPRGHLHPLTQVKNDVLAAFRDLGFVVAHGPEVELEENNFTKLGFPPDHPATDMQDTFWIRPGLLLRTHTSNVQVREMIANKPPLAIVSAGPVYRKDEDVTHSPMFHQVEGFLVDEHVTFAELKGVLSSFAQRIYGSSTPVRFRPSYFPFVEPGAEVDVGCAACRRADGSRAGCRVCKFTGWVEILGCGMVHPVVFEHTGIDPEKYTGFAFGLGIERVAMVRYDIPDVRLLFENDPRLLAQF
ncbi:MAG: phenylalanine--tRNA ligase subunit alpha [Polyangiaceae bacterium]